MTLAEYESEIVSLENGTFAPAAWMVKEYGSPAAARRAAARMLATEIRGILWSGTVKKEAVDLAERAATIAASGPIVDY